VEGSCGSGKTEFLLGLTEQAIAAGSGALYVDGKGDLSVFAKVFHMARCHGRLDDLLVVNLIGGRPTTKDPSSYPQSNTLNPFATASWDILVQIVVSLMDEVGGDGAMWKGRAVAMFTGLLQALVWLRDQEGLKLDVGVVRDHLGLKAIIGLASGASAPGLPEHIRLSVSNYLTSLPGYNPERGERQPQVVLEQHGYLEMQFTKILGPFTDIYDHVFAAGLAEVDMRDAYLNRRIVVVLLPSLEKFGDEVSDLGKLVVASLKAVMSAALGYPVTGAFRGVVDRRRPESDAPFLCVLDEVGRYMVEGIGLLAAQARALGFSMVYGVEDLVALRRYNEKEAHSLIANTNTKVLLHTREIETSSGCAYDFAAPERRARMDWERRLRRRGGGRDVQGLLPGEGIVLFKGAQVHMMPACWAPKPPTGVKGALRANHFFALPRPGAFPGAAR